MTPRLRRAIPCLLFVLPLLALLGWQLVVNPIHRERDAVQERLDTASPPLMPGLTAGQTFVSHHPGLSSVEILLVVYDPSREIPANARLIMTLERLDVPDQPPVRVELSGAGMQHNQRVEFPFDPLADSESATYRFTLSSNGAHGLGAWYSQTEAYAYGERLENGAPRPGDLYFVTGYDYRLTDALGDVGQIVGGSLGLVLALLLLLGLPGFVLSLYLLPGRRLDGVLYAGLILSLSMAFWPLVWLWASVAGLSLVGGRIWGVIGLLLLAGAARLWGRRDALVRPVIARKDAFPVAVLAMVLLAIGATRVLQVRELDVPAWIDSVHHTVLTQLLSERGNIPATFEPYLPAVNFHYHFGFHSQAAALMGLSGLPSHRAVLILGQVLNAASALVVAAWASRLARNRWAGVAAAIVVGLLSTMPAYYVSWGRYTQLTGLVLLPATCLATLALLEERNPGRPLLMGGYLLAGLFLAHYRVLVFYVLFWGVYALIALGRGRFSRVRLGQIIRRSVGLAGVALLFALPWLVRLLVRLLPDVGTLYGGWEGPEGYNDFPTGLIDSGWTRQLLIAAGVGAAWGLLRRRVLVVGIAVWVGLWLLAANLRVIGLFDIWLIHNSSVVISLWLPTGLLIGWMVGDLANLARRGAKRMPSWVPRQVGALVGAALLVLSGWAAWRMVDVVNPVTVLTTRDDVYAMGWVAEHTPADARFLINTRFWQGDLYVGSDGGWWLPILSRREVTLPSVLYQQSPPAYRQAIVHFAQFMEKAPAVDDPALIERLRQAGVTHVFVGARGGRFMPKDLDASPYFALRYASGPVRVYDFIPDAGE